MARELKNLKAEMARFGISNAVMGEKIGKTGKTVNEKVSGLTQFGVDDAIAIRDAFFPGMTLEYLFARTKASESA